MKKKTCITTGQILFWTIAGYAVYTAVLYWQRKPVCEYAKKICQQVNQQKI